MPSKAGTWSKMSLSATHSSKRSPHILIVRLGAMGDVVQTLPAASDLRIRFPDAHIAWAVDSRWAPLLRDNPHLDMTVPVPLRQWRRAKGSLATWEEAGRLLRELRRAEFDLAIDFQGLLKSAAIAASSRSACVLGFERSLLRESAAELLYDRRMASAKRHVIERYRELAWFGSGSPPLGEAQFPLPAETSCHEMPKRFVLASPEAGWGLKQWPREHFSALAARIWEEHGIPLVADCAPGREAYVRRIRRAAPPGAVITHPSTIPQLIAATRLAMRVVGVDSGPLHLAAALGKQGVAIFGPTDPERNGPYGNRIKVVRDPEAETTYKRDRKPGSSMWACGPDMVYQRLALSVR